MAVSRTEAISERLQEILDLRFDITHVTLQFETVDGEPFRCSHDHPAPSR